MKPVNKIIKTLTAAALMTLLTLNFNACTEQSPLQTNDDLTVVRRAPGELNILKSVNGPSLNKLFVTEKLITEEEGGKVKVGDDEHGESRLKFEDHSVSQDVLVRFEWESSGFLEGGASFSPHGTVFLKPVEIRLSYKDADLNGVKEADLKIWYFNEEVNMWELIGDDVDMEKKRVKGYINHFSRYAIGAE